MCQSARTIHSKAFTRNIFNCSPSIVKFNSKKHSGSRWTTASERKSSNIAATTCHGRLHCGRALLLSRVFESVSPRKESLKSLRRLGRIVTTNCSRFRHSRSIYRKERNPGPLSEIFHKPWALLRNLFSFWTASSPRDRSNASANEKDYHALRNKYQLCTELTIATKNCRCSHHYRVMTAHNCRFATRETERKPQDRPMSCMYYIICSNRCLSERSRPS